MPFGRVFRLNFNGLIKMLITREIACFLSFTSRTLTTQELPPPSVTYFTIGRPIVRTSTLPLRCREIARKRVVFHSLLSPSSPNSSLGSHHHQCYSYPLEYHHCHFPFSISTCHELDNTLWIIPRLRTHQEHLQVPQEWLRIYTI